MAKVSRYIQTIASFSQKSQSAVAIRTIKRMHSIVNSHDAIMKFKIYRFIDVVNFTSLQWQRAWFLQSGRASYFCQATHAYIGKEIAMFFTT